MSCRTVSRSGFSRLELAVILGVVVGLLALLIPAVNSARNAARLTQSKCALKNLGLALCNYHDLHKRLPPGSTIDTQNVGHHGWFTQILPYLDASPTHSIVNFDYPWDDNDARHVIAEQLNWKDDDAAPIYNDRTNREIFKAYSYDYLATIPGVPEKRTTEGYGLIHYAANPRVLYRNSSVGFDDFSEGTAHGWLLGEANGRYLPWGAPFNWREWNEQLNSSDTSYGRPTDDGALFLIADGSVRLISNAAAVEAMRALDGGLPPVDPEDVRVPPQEWEYVR